MKPLTTEPGVGEKSDLTQHEAVALRFTHNLADAHTHQSQSPSQREIIAQLPDLWYAAENSKQHEVNEAFINAFFKFRNQPAALSSHNHPMLAYASSISIAIVGTYLAKQNLTVALLEPCFDNLPDLFRHSGVKLVRLEEEWLHHPNTYELLEKNLAEVDALMIVDPNNPTGTTLFAEQDKPFEELLRFAKDKNKLLIFDFCFSPYLTGDPTIAVPDVYELLQKSGVSYLVIEDTGKIWPTQDIKASILSCSSDLYADVHNIHSSYLLNVSPFALAVLTAYIKDSKNDMLDSISSLLKTNRGVARKELAGSILEIQQPQLANMSVLWCKITDPTINATTLQEKIREAGVYVLPGTYFFWYEPQKGQRYIRIALARDTDMFTDAIKVVRGALDAHTPNRAVLHEKSPSHR